MAQGKPSSIILGNVVVRQDRHGRYSLNDLHRAAGGEQRHRPSEFLHIGPTRELIDELERERCGQDHIAPVETIRGGPNQGTFVCRELVYAYAVWVSAAFNLKVIQAFDAMVTGATIAAVREAVAERFLGANLSKWVKRFPDKFYQEIFRLHRWTWDGPSTSRPSVIAHYTNDIVYERLAPGLLRHLQARNPIDANGNRPSRHHQHLSTDIGHPALAEHLRAVINLMSRCQSWEQFMHLLDFLHPRQGHTLLLPIIEDLLPLPPSTR